MIKRIGVELKEGCDIQGGDLAIKALQESLVFDEVYSVNPGLLRLEDPLYISAVTDINLRLKQGIRSILKEGHFPVVFGGDHALAIGSISANLTPETGVLWIDAHGDCNTVESSPSHRIHGMPLAILQGHGHPRLTAMNDVVLKAKDILQIGIRSLDDEEQALMDRWGVRYITMSDIKANGYGWMIKEVAAFVATHPRIHVSFDCDSVDPKDAPGVNTPYKNGLSLSDVMTLLTSLDYDKVFSMDIVEFNPTRDNGQTKAMILAIDALVSDKKGT
jgi:arginase